MFKKDRLRFSLDDLINSSFINKYGLSKIFNTSKLIKKKSSISEGSTAIVEKISAILNIEETQVKSAI